MILKRNRKKYEKRARGHDLATLIRQKKWRISYGLRNKKEIYRIYRQIKNYRIMYFARLEKNLRLTRTKLVGAGILKADQGILALTPEKFFDRRLQTIICNNFKTVKSMRHARKLIVQGAVTMKIAGLLLKIMRPAYLVPLGRENSLQIQRVFAPVTDSKIKTKIK